MRLLDLSGKIDECTLALYEHIIAAASALEIQFFVIGATARDLILDRNYNIRPFRATEDVDLGVRVADWEQFAALKAGWLRPENLEKTSWSTV